MNFVKQYQKEIIICAFIFIAVAAIELFMGRSWFGPSGSFGFWSGDIYSSDNSQRVFDAYSLTHVIHGFIFYCLLWLFVRRLPLKYRFLAAVILEAFWEVMENSPIIINRYRETTISLGYVGDSVLNSLSDIVMMMLGYWAAYKWKVWQSVLAVVGIEILLLLWVRDNLILNIVMLIHPIESIKNWQSAGH